jgi:hypothetical protein
MAGAFETKSPRARIAQPHVEVHLARSIEEGIIMKGLLALLVLLLIVIAGFGFYRGWFHLSTDSAGHKSNVTLSVDQDKFQKDEATAKEKVQGLGHKTQETTGNRSDKVEEQERRP